MPLYPLLAPHAELGKVTTLNTLRTLSSLEASDMGCSAWRPGAERHSSSTALHILRRCNLFVTDEEFFSYHSFGRSVGKMKDKPSKHVCIVCFKRYT